MQNSKKLCAVWLLVPAILGVAACGKDGDASSAAADKDAVENAADASVTDMSLDASTADAMSVDVAAGGVDPMTDAAVQAPASTADAAATEFDAVPVE